MNQTLKSKLQILVNDHMDDWDELVDNVLFAYRSSRQASTKCTPFLLMYGHEARLPINLARISEKGEEICSEQEFNEKVKCMLELRAKVHSNALANVTKAQEQQKKNNLMQNITPTLSLMLETK